MLKSILKSLAPRGVCAFALVALCAIFLSGCAGQKSAAPAPGPEVTGQTPPTQAPSVKVALLLPLTGSHSALGQAMLNSAQMALFDVGYKDFQLLPRDTKGTPEGAAAAAAGAVKEGAQIILGPVFADEVSAARPIAASANVNIIAFSTDWNLAGGNVFIMGFLPFDQIQRVVGYASSQNLKRIGVVAPGSEYGRAVIPSYEQAATKFGVSTVQTLTVQPDAPGATDAVRSLASSNLGKIDAVFLPMGGSAAAGVSYALTQGGLPPPAAKRLGTGLFDDDTLAANPAMDGAWFAAPAPEKRRAFEAKFMQAYSFVPPRLSTLAYDATALASALAQRGAFTKEAITNPNGFAGLDGIFRFRTNGMAERGLAVLQYRNGHIEVADPAPATFQAMTQ